jgi:hypothetical protein
MLPNKTRGLERIFMIRHALNSKVGLLQYLSTKHSMNAALEEPVALNVQEMHEMCADNTAGHNNPALEQSTHVL